MVEKRQFLRIICKNHSKQYDKRRWAKGVSRDYVPIRPQAMKMPLIEVHIKGCFSGFYLQLYWNRPVPEILFCNFWNQPKIRQKRLVPSSFWMFHSVIGWWVHAPTEVARIISYYVVVGLYYYHYYYVYYSCAAMYVHIAFGQTKEVTIARTSTAAIRLEDW